MYFNSFPLTTYLNFKHLSNLYDNDLKDVVVRDILKRVSFTSDLKEQAGLFYDYDIRDGETPELIADKLYGSPYYHWILLLFNDIIDPYEDWAKDDRSIENHIQRKYPGLSLFLVHAHDGTGENAVMCGLTFGKNETIIKTYGTKDDYGRWNHVVGSTGSPTDIALVHNWDRQYSRLDIRDMAGQFSTGDYIGVGKEDDSFDFAMIMKVTPSRFALHHFEEEYTTGIGVTLEGERKYLDPLSASSGAAMGHTGHTGEHTSTTVKFSETRLASYMGVNGSPSSTNVITNEQYEWNKREDIRAIKILHPRYLELVVDEFRKLLSDSTIVK